MSNDLQQFLGEKEGLDQGKMRTFLFQSNANVWEQVLESFNPALEITGAERQSVIEDVGCLLHLVFFICIEDGLRDKRALDKKRFLDRIIQS